MVVFPASAFSSSVSKSSCLFTLTAYLSLLHCRKCRKCRQWAIPSRFLPATPCPWFKLAIFVLSHVLAGVRRAFSCCGSGRRLSRNRRLADDMGGQQRAGCSRNQGDWEQPLGVATGHGWTYTAVGVEKGPTGQTAWGAGATEQGPQVTTCSWLTTTIFISTQACAVKITSRPD